MATRVLNPRDGIWQGSNTVTTGGTVTTSVLASAGFLNFRQQYANGATGVPLYLYDSATGIFESSYGTLTYGATAALDTISSRVILRSTNGVATPVAWGSGARDALCSLTADEFLCKTNAGSELSSTQATNFRIALGVVFGTATGNVNVLDVNGRHDLSTLPVHTHNSTVAVGMSQTGGSNSTIVRVNGAGTFTTAANTDTKDQLRSIAARGSDGKYYWGGQVPFGSITQGVVYYLGAAGALTSTAPAVDAGTGTKLVVVGVGTNTNELLFRPYFLVVTDDGFAPTPTTMLYKKGYMQQ